MPSCSPPSSFTLTVSDYKNGKQPHDEHVKIVGVFMSRKGMGRDRSRGSACVSCRTRQPEDSTHFDIRAVGVSLLTHTRAEQWERVSEREGMRAKAAHIEPVRNHLISSIFTFCLHIRALSLSLSLLLLLPVNSKIYRNSTGNEIHPHK